MFEIKNQSKIKRTSIIMLSMVLILTLVFQCSPFEQKVSAEGSKDINAVEKDTSGKDYYRAYTDYETNATAGIKRETVVYVYAFAGETLYFGSDISNSKIDINENVKSKETDVDIVMTEPNGTKHPFNVIQNGQGHIGTQTKEKTGPYSSSDTAISGNTGGYTPLSYTVTADGIYEFRFHSVTGNATTSGGGANPTKNTIASGNIGPQNNMVSMWDLTVVGIKKGTENERQVKTGRTFSKYLALSTGANGINMNSRFYVVTTDGYIYKTTFNALDPFGFVFFANSRGFVSLDKTNASVYKSVKVNGQTGGTQLDTLNNYGLTYQNPMDSDTDLDKTFDVFYEQPSSELEGILYPKAYQPESATNLRFIGSNGDSKTYEGCGGYFEFDITKATSATVNIDLSSATIYQANGELSQNVILKKDETLSDGTVMKAGTTISKTTSAVKLTADQAEALNNENIISINNAVVEGTNRFWWDGNDAYGAVVPANVYSSDNIKVSVNTKSGEYHFPLLDAEYNPGGITCERINKIYQTQVVNGKITDVDVTANSINENSKYMLYYNNTLISTGESAVLGKTGSVKSQQFVSSSTKDGSKLDETEGISSENGIMKYNGNDTDGSRCGDYTALDIWTYSPRSAALSLDSSKTITVLPNDGKVSISGFLFYDKDQSKKYELNNGDKPLNGFKVSLLDSNGAAVTDSIGNPITAETDVYGRYTFTGVPYIKGTATTYKVLITADKNIYTVTTEDIGGDVIQIITIPSSNTDTVLYAKDVGLNYETSSKSIKILKTWTTSSDNDPEQPTSVDVTLEAYYTDASNVEHSVTTYVKTLSKDNGWTYTYTLLPSKTGSSALQYKIKQEDYYYKGNSKYSAKTYTSYGGGQTSNDDLPYVTSFVKTELSTTTTQWDVVNSNSTYKGTIELTKLSAQTGEALAGATFEVYKGTKDDYSNGTLVATKTSDSNGKIYFTNLAAGNTYFLKETKAPDGYKIAQTYYGDFAINFDDATQTGYNITAYNPESNLCKLKVTKKVDGVIDGATINIHVLYNTTNNFTSGYSEVTQTIDVTTGKDTYTAIFDHIPKDDYIRVYEEMPITNANNLITLGSNTYLNIDGIPIAAGDYNTYKLLTSKSYFWDGADTNTKVQFTVNPNQTNTKLVSSQYITGQQLTDPKKTYQVYMENAKRFASNMSVEKVWKDENGNNISSSVDYTENGTAEISLNTQVYVKLEGEPDSSFKELSGYTLSDAQKYIVKDTATGRWLKNFNSKYWGFPYSDENGNRYVYRFEEAKLPTDYTATYWYNTNEGTGYNTTDNVMEVITNQKTSTQPTVNFTFKKISAKGYTTNSNNKISGYTPLSGAEFKLYICSNTTSGHTHTTNAPADGCWYPYQTATSGNDGSVSFTGLLRDSEYRLVETKAPSGYMISKGQWKLQVANDGTVKLSTADESNPPLAYVLDTNDTICIPNNEVPNVPTLGNRGIYPYVTVGFFMMGGACVYFIFRKKRNAHNAARYKK